MRSLLHLFLFFACTAVCALAENAGPPPDLPRRARHLPADEHAAMAAAISAANTGGQSAERIARILALLARAGYQVEPRESAGEYQLVTPQTSSRPLVFKITLYPVDTAAARFADFHHLRSSMPGDFNPRLMFRFQLPHGTPVVASDPELLSPQIMLSHLRAALAELPDITTQAPGPLRLDTDRQRQLLARTQTLLTMRKTLEAWRVEIENMDEAERTEPLQARGRVLEEAVGKLDEAIASLQEEHLALSAANPPSP